MVTTTGIIRQAGEGEQMWFAGGGDITWKATAEETGGTFLLFEDVMARGKTTPLHTHPEGESMYVLAGELLVHVDGEDHPVGTGGFVHMPPGVPHAFLVTSDEARVLALQAPGSGERFYRDAGEPIRSAADAGRPADFSRLRRVADASPSIEILGPPPFAAVAGR